KGNERVPTVREGRINSEKYFHTFSLRGFGKRINFDLRAVKVNKELVQAIQLSFSLRRLGTSSIHPRDSGYRFSFSKLRLTPYSGDEIVRESELLGKKGQIVISGTGTDIDGKSDDRSGVVVGNSFNIHSTLKVTNS